MLNCFRGCCGSLCARAPVCPPLAPGACAGDGRARDRVRRRAAPRALPHGPQGTARSPRCCFRCRLLPLVVNAHVSLLSLCVRIAVVLRALVLVLRSCVVLAAPNCVMDCLLISSLSRSVCALRTLRPLSHATQERFAKGVRMRVSPPLISFREAVVATSEVRGVMAEVQASRVVAACLVVAQDRCWPLLSECRWRGSSCVRQ